LIGLSLPSGKLLPRSYTWLQIQNLETENYTLQETLSTANNKIQENAQKEKDYEEQINTLNHKVQMLEKAEEDYQVIIDTTRDAGRTQWLEVISYCYSVVGSCPPIELPIGHHPLPPCTQV